MQFNPLSKILNLVNKKRGTLQTFGFINFPLPISNIFWRICGMKSRER